jgi:hypothetical protein
MGHRIKNWESPFNYCSRELSTGTATMPNERKCYCCRNSKVKVSATYRHETLRTIETNMMTSLVFTRRADLEWPRPSNKMQPVQEDKSSLRPRRVQKREWTRGTWNTWYETEIWSGRRSGAPAASSSFERPGIFKGKPAKKVSYIYVADCCVRLS